MPSKSLSHSIDRPGWVRPRGAAMYTGLCVRTVHKILTEGKVRSKLVRLEGSGRACRLIELKSLDEYISSF